MWKIVDWWQDGWKRSIFLGALRAVGHTLMQFVQQENQVVAVLVWAASAYHLKDRDQWIGWDAITCAKRRNLITNNVRFLVREEHRRPNLASQSLAAALKVLPQQWQEQFGYRPLLAETFTDPELHAGTCYKASGWEALGHTKGHSRHRCDFYIPNERPKRLWIKPLHPRAREWLCAPQLPPECQAGQRPEGAGARCALKMKQLQSLREALRSIPDPRAAKGRQYPLWTVLCVVALGLLSGCVHLSEIVRLGQRLSQAQRRGLGSEFHCLVTGTRGNRLSIRTPDYAINVGSVPLQGAQQFACGGLPEFYCVVKRARGNRLSIRTPGYACNLVSMPLQGAQQLARRGLPELHRVVKRARGQGLFIWTPGYTANRIDMPLQGAQQFARRGLPEFHCVVTRTRGQGLSIRAPGYAINVGSVPLQGPQQLARRGLPELHCLVTRTRGQSLSIRTPGYACNLVSMPLQGAQQLARRGLPELHRVVKRARGQGLSSGLQATLLTVSICPCKVLSNLPVAASQSFTVWSREPEARVFPSGLQATL